MPSAIRTVCCAAACLVVASHCCGAQFRPFDNARVRRTEGDRARVILGPDAPLAVVVQRPADMEGLDDQARRRWPFRYSYGAVRLGAYLKRITGLEVRVYPRTDAPADLPGFPVYVGRNDWGIGNAAELDSGDIDGHGFIIRTLTDPEGRACLWIAGPTEVGTSFGVLYLLQDYCDVRWVMRGELGEVVPRRETIEIPDPLDLVHPGPDFLLRIWSGVAGFDPSLWLADTGATARFQYHHNLWRVFPPEKYGEQHPDLYPFYEGSRQVPQPVEGRYPRSAWQICFSNPNAPDLAMEYARELFATRPEMQSLSLSVNDSLGYCDCDRCRELSAASQAEGFRSYSGAYYRFVNKVARHMKEEFPDRYVAFLPYGMVTEPPEVPLEDNVMMFIFGEPVQVLENWEGKVTRYGYYQWLYGMGWVVSNFWPHAMQECLQMLYERGARAFKGEAYCGWGWGGPKLWALANTLWDRNVDVDACLRDYCQHAYGPEAAPAVARFFEKWEQIHERRRTDTEFYFTRYGPGDYQFEHVTAADYEALDKDVQEALKLVQGERNRQRLELLQRAFEQGRYFLEEYDVVRTLGQAELDSVEAAKPLIELAAEYHRYQPIREEHFRKYVEPAEYDVLFFERSGKMDLGSFYSVCRFTYPQKYDDVVDGLFGKVTSLLTKQDSAAAAEAYWRDLGVRTPVLLPYAGTQITLLRASDEPLPNMLENGSFEEPLAETQQESARNWGVYYNRNINATSWRDDSTAAEGEWSGTVKGAGDIVGFMRSVKVACGGRYRVGFHYKTKQQKGEAQCWFYANTEKGIWNPKRTLAPSEDWTSYEFTFTAPGERGSRQITLGLTAKRQGDGDHAWFDDARVEELYRPQSLD